MTRRVWRGRPLGAVFATVLGAASAGCGADRGTIGALLAQDAERRLVVREAPAGLAADRAGVRPGDEILLVEGRDVRGMTAEQIHQALSGEVDEPVKLTLVRERQVVRVTLRRTKAQRRPRPSESAPEVAAP